MFNKDCLLSAAAIYPLTPEDVILGSELFVEIEKFKRRSGQNIETYQLIFQGILLSKKIENSTPEVLKTAFDLLKNLTGTTKTAAEVGSLFLIEMQKLKPGSQENYPFHKALFQGIFLAQELTKLGIQNPRTLEYGLNLLRNLSDKAKTHPEIYEVIAKRVNQRPDQELFLDTIKLVWNKAPSPTSPYTGTPLESLFRNETLLTSFGERPIITSATIVAGGTFGEIYRVQEINHIALSKLLKMAVKIPKERRGKEELNQEVIFLKALHDQRGLLAEDKLKIIPKPIGVTYMEKDGFLIPFYEGGNLADYIEDHPLALPQKIAIAAQILEQAFIIIHKAKAIYTDIRLDNVLVSTDPVTVKLADFGNCYFIEDQKCIEGNLTFNLGYTSENEGMGLCYPCYKEPEEFQFSLYKHASRAIGLLLCGLFLNRMEPVSDGSYTLAELDQYYRTKDPLASLKQAHPGLAAIIEKMLGLNWQEQLFLDKACSAWTQFLISL